MKQAEVFLTIGSDGVRVGVDLDMPRPSALAVLDAFVDTDGAIDPVMHRDDLMSLSGLSPRKVSRGGDSLVQRGLASWDEEIGREALCLNDLGLMLALYRRASKGGRS